MTSESILNQIGVANPCPADWSDMSGDEQVRFCGQCQKHVYNLAEIPAERFVSLIQESEGDLCIRLFRRHDGTVLNGDCPVGVRRVWSKWKRLVGVVSTAAVVALAAKLAPSLQAGVPGVQVSTSGVPDSPGPVLVALQDFMATLKDWLGIEPEPGFGPMMGELCVPAGWPTAGPAGSEDAALPPAPPAAIRRSDS